MLEEQYQGGLNRKIFYENGSRASFQQKKFPRKQTVGDKTLDFFLS